MIVNKKCDDKCFCIDGYVREFGPNGSCIPINTCPIVDPPPMKCDDPNSTFKSCGTVCEPTCDIPNPLSCTKNCKSGCFCNAGYIKDSTGICIPIDKCPKLNECPANEVFDCRNPTCGEQGCFWLCMPAPDTPCVNKCFCADGYRRINGICIPEKKCPKKMITCNEYEVFECRETDNVPCEYKCYCGNIDGKCVKCPMPNTEYRTCVNPCTEPSCANPTTALIKCAYACEDGCYCKEGFVKSDDGSCIKLDQCPSEGENSIELRNLLIKILRFD